MLPGKALFNPRTQKPVTSNSPITMLFKAKITARRPILLCGILYWCAKNNISTIRFKSKYEIEIYGEHKQRIWSEVARNLFKQCCNQQRNTALTEQASAKKVVFVLRYITNYHFSVNCCWNSKCYWTYRQNRHTFNANSLFALAITKMACLCKSRCKYKPTTTTAAVH